MLSDKQIAQFQKIYRERFGKEIGVDEAREKGVLLINFFKTVLKPMSEEDFRELEKRNQIK